MLPNEVREGLGQKRVDDANADKLYVKNGYTLLEDLNIAVPDIPNTSNDFNKNA